MHEAGKLPPQPWMTAPATQAVLAALSAEGAEVRFVGGCVRDAVIGRPVTDVDIATHDPPARVMALLAAAGIKAVPTGLQHGTVTAVAGGAHFEITTLRRDVETFGRRARVEYTDDWAEDAARRDLTINALFLGPDGTLFDPFGGLADLHAGRVRFVGAAEARIREDVLRLLRFFRFYAHYGRPPPDAEALAACRRLAPLLPTLSAERVWAELRKLLAAPEPGPVLALMESEGVLAHVLPAPRAIARAGALAAIEGALGETDPLRRLAALLEQDAAGMAAAADGLRLSNAEKARLVRIAEAWPGFAPLPDPAGRARWYYRHGPGGGALYRDLLLLHGAAARAAGAALGEESAAGAAPAGEDAAAALRAAAAEAGAWTSPRFPLGGADVQALGIAPGPRVGALLRAVEDWWVERDFAPSRAQCRGRLAAIANREKKEGEGRA